MPRGASLWLFLFAPHQLRAVATRRARRPAQHLRRRRLLADHRHANRHGECNPSCEQRHPLAWRNHSRRANHRVVPHSGCALIAYCQQQQLRIYFRARRELRFNAAAHSVSFSLLLQRNRNLRQLLARRSIFLADSGQPDCDALSALNCDRRQSGGHLAQRLCDTALWFAADSYQPEFWLHPCPQCDRPGNLHSHESSVACNDCEHPIHHRLRRLLRPLCIHRRLRSVHRRKRHLYHRGCLLPPPAQGSRSGTLTVATDAGTVTAALSGFGTADPGIALATQRIGLQQSGWDYSHTQQVVTVTNTGKSSGHDWNSIYWHDEFQRQHDVRDPCAFGTVRYQLVHLRHRARSLVHGTHSYSPSLRCQARSSRQRTSPFRCPVHTPRAPLVSSLRHRYPISVQPPPAQLGPRAPSAVTNATAQSLNLSLSVPRQFPLARRNELQPTFPPGPPARCLFHCFPPSTERSLEHCKLQYARQRVADSIARLPVSDTASGRVRPDHHRHQHPPSTLATMSLSGQSQSQTLTLLRTPEPTRSQSTRITSEPPFIASTTCGNTLVTTGITVVQFTLNLLPPYMNSSSKQQYIARPAGCRYSRRSRATPSPAPDTIQLAGTATAITTGQPTNSSVLATYTLSSGSLTFGATQVGNISPAQTVTLTNSGTATLHIASVLAPDDFTATSTCSTLLPSATCTIAVQVVPGDISTQSLRTGTLEIRSDSADALEFFTLVGSSTPPTARARTDGARLRIDHGRSE